VGEAYSTDSLRAGSLQVAFDPLLTPAITLFNLSAIARSTRSRLPPNDTDILSINSQITRNISWSVGGGNSTGIYMAMYGIRIMSTMAVAN